MPRIILIDAHTGYIWGDSADLDGRVFTEDLAHEMYPDLRTDTVTGFAYAFVSALDSSLGETGRLYSMRQSPKSHGDSGYVVYRADINGSEAVPVVHDGQDKETIRAVEENCLCLGFISYEHGVVP